MNTASRKSARLRRSRLVANGHTYESFARLVGVSARTVKAAVRGERITGEKARRVLRKLEKLNAN